MRRHPLILILWLTGYVGLVVSIWRWSDSWELRWDRSVSKVARAMPPTITFDTEACRQTYSGFYRRPTLEIRIVFGYKDARPARFVADRYERMLMIQSLTRTCPPHRQDCGFARVERDADLFTKEIPGPDGQTRQIQLRVIAASAGADDLANRQDPFQKWRSKYAQSSFLSGLQQADVVFYNGHSRAGGGPDFAPPRLTPSQEVDFGWYKKNEPGFLAVLEALNAPSTQSKILGLFSCASSQHFLNRAREAKKSLGFITSPRLLYFSDALSSSLQAISSLLDLQCERKFETSLKTDETRASGARVSGFF